MRKNTLASYENLVCMTLEDEQIFQKITSDPIYDQMNRVTSQTDPANATTAYTYDQNGNQLSMTNALNNTWTMQFDAKNRMISRKFPLTPSDNGIQREMKMEYNKNDELTASISPSGRTWRYTYDARGQQKTKVDPLSATISYNYDINQNLITLSDQRGKVTSFDYDELYRVVKVTDPTGNFTRTNYDEEGNVTSVIDRLGRTTTINYDELDRPTTVNFVDATVSYQYDAAGRKLRVDDTQFGGTFIAWNYDNANRVISETTPQGIVTYTYNQADQRASLNVVDRSPVNYVYDNAGRLSTISQNLGQSLEVFTYNYDVISRKTSLQRPNDITSFYEYDQDDRLTRLKHQKASNPAIEDFQYGFNQESEYSTINSLFSLPQLANNQVASVADNNNRINQFGNASFSFNALGETTNKSVTGQGTTTYQWDHRGRLIKVTLANNEEINYSYDAVGRRISTNHNSVTKEFLYDVWDVVLDINSDGSKVDYINNPYNYDEKLRQVTTSTNPLYFIQDHLGSTIALADNTSNIVERIQYDAFGQSSSNLFTRYLYTGREYDNLTQLTYYRARWYDSQQGRFLSEDPIGFEGGLNVYSYVDNDPISLMDPFGLLPIGDENGRKVPKSNKAYNCYAWVLGLQPQGTFLPGDGDWPKGISFENYLRKKGCKEISCNELCSCENQRKIKVYIPGGNFPDSPHAMLYNCNGTWSSKNGEIDFLYIDIKDPDKFYRLYFGFGLDRDYAKVKSTCFCCSIR